LFAVAVPIVVLALLIASTVTPQAYALTVIAFDAAASNSCAHSCAPTLSWSHTVGFGSNRILVVGVAINDPTVWVASISYGSSSLTALVNPGQFMAMYYLLNPAIGTATVTVTFTAVNLPAIPVLASGGSMSYFNVAGVGASSSNTGSGNPASVTVAANAGDLVVDLLGAGTGAVPVSVGSGQTQRWMQPTVGAGSDKIASSPVTMTWTLEGGTYEGGWDLIAAVLTPGAPPQVGPPVGGFIGPVNNLAMLSPWLAVIGLVGCIGTVAVVVAKKRIG
jgi:hypothetical protein